MKLFYLHGMGGSPADWDAVARIAPGCALTVPLAPSFSDAAEQLAAQLREQTEPFTIVGYSMGGRFALAVASLLAEIGSPPARVVLVSTGLGFRHQDERERRFIVDERWAALAEDNLSAFWREWYAQPLFTSFGLLDPATQTTWLAARNVIDSRTLTTHLRTYSPARHEYLLPIVERLLASGVSLLYLAGELDEKYVAVGRELATTGLATQVIPDAGHAIPLEAPAAIARAIGAR